MNYQPHIKLDEHNPYTIRRKLEEDIFDKKDMDAETHFEVLQIIEAIANVVKAISGKLKMPCLLALYHSHKMHIGEVNASGDHQKDLDVLSNNIVKNMLRTCTLVRSPRLPLGRLHSE